MEDRAATIGRSWLGRARRALAYLPHSRVARRWTRPRWWYMASRRTTPISPIVGLDRGRPIDRHFIERFLERHAARIRGRVLEVKDRAYTERFGGYRPGAAGGRVTRSDVLDINRENREATVFDDLRSLGSIADGSYDCLIVTQVLQYVDDLDAAIASMRRVLAPGGCVLVTAPTVGKLDGQEDRVEGHYWRLTTDSARYLFGRHFRAEDLTIEGWGNARLGMSFLAGLAVEDMTPRELEHVDPFYQCGVLVLAVKGA